MKRILFVVVCSLLLTGADPVPPSVEAPKSDPKTANYIVLPVTTELQRKGIFDEKTRVYLLMNASAAIKDDSIIRANAIDFDTLFREVGYNSILYDGEKNGFQADILYKQPAKNSVSALFENALEGVGRRNFKHVEVTTQEEIKGVRTWQGKVDPILRTTE